MDSAVLTILQADDRYTVTLETARKGPLALAGTVWVGHDHRQDIVRIVDAVTDIINRQAGSDSPYRGDVSSMAQVCEVGSLEEFGQLMYGLFLPPLIQNALRELDAPLIISTNDCQIPWELLHDGQTFLGLRAPVSRRLMVTRWVAGGENALSAEPTFLIITNPLGDLPDADQEASELMALLDARGIPYDLLRGPRATYVGVQQAFVSGRYEVIHYTGHAFFDQEHPERSGLHLAGGRNLPASQIEGILRGRPIVFLNACSSARQGDATDNPAWQVGYTGPQAEGLASAFISGGASGFLGAQWPIFDAGSREFAISFYRALLDGASTGEALQTARAVVREHRPADATWASFIFYGDPASRIAETAAEMVARAEERFAAGEWDQAQAILEQLALRGQEVPEATALAQRIANSRAEKARLDALYRDGLAAFERGEWQTAADCLAPVVSAEGAYEGAQEKLIEARRQLELASLMTQARAQAKARRWRSALELLERLQQLDPTYPGLAEALAQAQAKVAAERERIGRIPHPGILATIAAALVLVAAFVSFGLGRQFGGAGMVPTVSPTASVQATPVPSATPEPPSPTTIVLVFVTPVPVTPTPTPTPTRPPGWSRLDNLGGAIVRSVAMDPQGSTIYLGTWGGGILRSSDGGRTWQSANKGLTNQHIWSVVTDPISPTVLYAGTNGGGLFRSEDGGGTWAPVPLNGDSGFIYALAAAVENQRTRLWAGTGQGKVYLSEDGGRTWKPTPSQPDGAGYINVFYVLPSAPGRPGRLYVGTKVGVFLSEDNGTTWKALTLRKGDSKPDIRDLVGDPRGPQIVYAGVAGEGVYRSHDGGNTWALVNQGMDNTRVRAMAIDPADPQIIYVGTDGGRVFRSSNGGDRWEAASAGLAGRSVQVLVANPSGLYAGTWGDGLFRSTDGGRNWAAVQGNLNALNVAAVLGDPASRDSILLAAYGKGIFHTKDGGATWILRQTGLSTEDIFTLVADPHTPTLIYALTTDGLFKSLDMGVKWQAINTGLGQERPQALAIAPSNTAILYASMGSGWIYRSEDRGEHWLRLESRPSQLSVLALAVDPTNPAIIYAGAGDGLYRSADSGTTWHKVYDGSVFALVAAPSGEVFAGTGGNGVLRGSANGTVWSRVGLDKLNIVTLAVAKGTEASKTSWLFAGTSSQGVFASRDGGTTWQSLGGDIAPFIQAIAVHPASPHDLLVATSNGLYVRSLEP